MKIGDEELIFKIENDRLQFASGLSFPLRLEDKLFENEELNSMLENKFPDLDKSFLELSRSLHAQIVKLVMQNEFIRLYGLFIADFHWLMRWLEEATLLHQSEPIGKPLFLALGCIMYSSRFRHARAKESVRKVFSESCNLDTIPFNSLLEKIAAKILPSTPVVFTQSMDMPTISILRPTSENNKEPRDGF